jgi:hypothetical protein
MLKFRQSVVRLKKENNHERLLERLSERVDDKEVLVELSAFNATLESVSRPVLGH